VVYGLIIEIPDLQRLHEALRNLFYHVPLWFSMIFILLLSMVFSIRYLNKGKVKDDIRAREAVHVGLLFGVLGFATGTVWGNYSWGDAGSWLINEPRSLAALIAMLFYVAYFILRGSIEEENKKARVAAVYNIFSYVMYIAFVIVIPRMTASLHPGAGGNPGFNVYDTDNNLKLVLYPAWLSFMLLAYWLYTIRVRMKTVEYELNYETNS
jgi:heme exporter protein C